MSPRKDFIYSVSAFCILTIICSCHVVRFFVYNTADIHDYKKFHNIDIKASGHPFIFSQADSSMHLTLDEVTINGQQYNWENFLDKTKTVAFVVIRNDTVLYSNYRRGYDQESIIPSFSIAKSFVSLLVGIAIDEGAIKDVNEPITNYLPDLKKNGFDHVTIENLLNMESGVKFNEGYFNPFGDVAKFYYGTNLTKYIKHLRLDKEPGQQFEYKSGNTQLLGMVVERAVRKNLADYMEDKVWKYIGAEHDASWSIDSKRDSEIKAFCCFNATTMDFAKLGRLYLNKGNWNGRQIVSKAWVERSLDASHNKSNGIYSYQWWHSLDYVNGVRKPSGDFFAEGILGEYVYVYPKDNIVIVRLGKKQKTRAWIGLMKAMARSLGPK